MKHLLSYSVYQDVSFFGEHPLELLEGMSCDGLELLTSYDPPPSDLSDLSPAVHLPYAPNWLAAWEDRPEDMPDLDSLYYMYGRSREELIRNVCRAIDMAALVDPAYGVFHAGNVDTAEIYHRTYSRPDSYVLREFCEMVNEVAAVLPGGEPPFKILFENLWWPGLRLTDDSGYRYIRDHVEFENWGICLDTGHLMSCLPTVSEEDGIERLLEIFDGYCADLIDSIVDVHFHWSASYEYRSTFEERELDCPVSRFVADANSHVLRIDRHLPYSSSRCNELLDALKPDFVAHEMPGSETGVLEDYRKQRSLLP